MKLRFKKLLAKGLKFIAPIVVTLAAEELKKQADKQLTKRRRNRDQR